MNNKMLLSLEKFQGCRGFFRGTMDKKQTNSLLHNTGSQIYWVGEPGLNPVLSDFKATALSATPFLLKPLGKWFVESHTASYQKLGSGPSTNYQCMLFSTMQFCFFHVSRNFTASMVVTGGEKIGGFVFIFISMLVRSCFLAKLSLSSFSYVLFTNFKIKWKN